MAIHDDVLKIGLAVCNCPFGNITSNIETLKKMTARAAEDGARIICFPEMNLTGYCNSPELSLMALDTDSPELSAISSIASDLSIVILSGFAEKGRDGRIFATHGFFYPDGTARYYRKIHIAPPEKKIIEQGNEIPVFEYLSVKFGIQLCYDAHFPELTTQMAVNGIDVLFIPHASPRGDSYQKLKSWMRHLPARAFDNGIYTAACNQVGDNGKGLVFPGISLVISPSGELAASMQTDKDDILYFCISKKELADFRSSRMKYFLPNRRKDLPYLKIVSD